MKIKRILIASALLNIILLTLVIILAWSSQTNQTDEIQGNTLVSDGTKVTPTEVFNKSIPTNVLNPSEESTSSEKDTNQVDIPYYYSDLMENPIDQTYLSLVTHWSYSQTEYRNFQARYYEIWQEEYHKVIKIIENKAVYQKDKQVIEQFDTSVESFFDNNYDFFVMAVLGDYSFPKEIDFFKEASQIN